MTGLLAAPDLDLFGPALQKWMPRATVRPPAKAVGGFDAVLTWKTRDGRPLQYVIKVKRHFRHQDARVIAEQLAHRRAALPPHAAGGNVLLLAPHIRAQQAAVLERAGIDYLDLAGNAHLHAPGLFVHVEGRRPEKEPARAPGRPQKGWIKTVMALLVQPDLAAGPYRVLADRAGVALGTLTACMKDLTIRGLLHGGKGGRRVVDRQALVALWVQAYVEGLRPRLTERRFQVRADDKPALQARLRNVLGAHGQRWALAGADAAERRTHFFRTEETEIYAPIRLLDDRDIQKALVAQPTVRGGNLLVIEAPGPLAIPDAVGDGFPIAPDLLAYAELRYRGMGQALEAAELLLPRVLGDAAA